MSAGTPTLTYFDIRGLGEIPRLLFAVADAKFTDDRIFFELKADGSVHKDPKWDERKKTMPYGQVPVLTVDGGVQIAQSAAIVRYISRRYGLNGGDEVESALIDMQYETLGELRRAYNAAKTDEEKAKLYGTTLGESIELLEKNYQSGKKVNYLDVALYYFLTTTLADKHDVVAKVLESAPKIKSVTTSVPAIPSVAKYLAARKVTIW